MGDKRALWGALVALLAWAVPLAASADPPERRGRGDHRFVRVLERNAERLGIDAATMQKVQELARADQASREDLQRSLREQRQAMRKLLAEERPDESALMERAEAMGELEIEAHKQRLRTMIRIRALLTPEQLEELGTIRDEERKARRGDRPRRRRPFGPGDREDGSERERSPEREPR